MSEQESRPRSGGGVFAPLRGGLARLRSSAPWALSRRFLLATLAVLVVVGGAGLVAGYAAAKAALPYFIRISVVDPAVHTVRTWLNMPQQVRWTGLQTHGGAVETAIIPITFAGQSFPASVEDLDGNLLVMAMDGSFFYMTPSYELRSLAIDLPMNWEGARAFADNPNFAPGFFRSLDLLAVPVATHAFDLYASYARYTGECFEIVVARRRATTTEAGIELDGANWEDVFVAEPCLAPKSTSYVFGGHQIRRPACAARRRHAPDLDRRR